MLHLPVNNPIPPPYEPMETAYVIYALISIMFYIGVLLYLHWLSQDMEKIKHRLSLILKEVEKRKEKNRNVKTS